MKLLTNNFNVFLANTFYNSVLSDNYYVYVSKTTPFEGDEDTIPQPENSFKGTVLDVNEQMIFGKKITENDVRFMIERKQWDVNEVYTSYDHQQENIEDTNFYVVTQDGDEYSVFKCIDNNNGEVSLIKPIRSETSPADDFYRTSDNYVWKLMYTIEDNVYDKFSTSSFVPIEEDPQIANNAIPGGIESVKVENSGAGYKNYISGTVSQISIGGNPRKLYIQGDSDTLSTTSNYYTDSAFYVTFGNAQGQLKSITEYGIEGNNKYVILDSSFTPQIEAGDQFEISPNIIVSGDGTGFKGRAIIDEETDSIERVEIVDRGTDYTQAIAEIASNTASFSSDQFTKASVRPIISPKGGHGSDSQVELFARYVGISLDFVEDNLPAANNDFYSFGIIKDPVFREAELILNDATDLSNNDIIIQANTQATGTISVVDQLTNTVTLENVQGVFNDQDDITSNSSNTVYTVANITKNNETFDQRTSIDFTVTFGNGFEKDEVVTQESTNASAIVHQIDGNTVKLINVQGNFAISNVSTLNGTKSNTRAVINNINEPDMIKGSADTFYIQNVQPITRTSDRTERTKIIIGF